MDYGTWSINYDSLNCLQAKQELQDGTCWNFFYCRSILWQSTCMFAFGHTSCVFFFCSSYHPFFACGDPFGFLGNRMKQSCWTDQDDVMARCHHLRGSLCGNEIYGRGSHTCPLWLLELGDLCLWWWTGSLGGLCNRTHSWSLTREFGVEIWVGKQEEHQKKSISGVLFEFLYAFFRRVLNSGAQQPIEMGFWAVWKGLLGKRCTPSYWMIFEHNGVDMEMDKKLAYLYTAVYDCIMYYTYGCGIVRL